MTSSRLEKGVVNDLGPVLVEGGEGRIPQSCRDCSAGWTENWAGKPVRCEDCTRPDCDDGQETFRHLPARCAMCDDPLTFGHAYEVRDANGEHVLICDDLECSRELRRAAHEPAPARTVSDGTAAESSAKERNPSARPRAARR